MRDIWLLRIDNVSLFLLRRYNTFDCKQNGFVLFPTICQKYTAIPYQDYSPFLWICVDVIRREHCAESPCKFCTDQLCQWGWCKFGLAHFYVCLTFIRAELLLSCLYVHNVRLYIFFNAVRYPLLRIWSHKCACSLVYIHGFDWQHTLINSYCNHIRLKHLPHA